MRTRRTRSYAVLLVAGCAALAFGAVARRTIERLKNSANAAVRRTAIQLMRQFGGSDALPDLTLHERATPAAVPMTLEIRPANREPESAPEPQWEPEPEPAPNPAAPGPPIQCSRPPR